VDNLMENVVAISKSLEDVIKNITYYALPQLPLT
jgi:hypothetical protein